MSGTTHRLGGHRFMPGHRPHLLFIAWGFPPCRAGGVYRALATANAFAAGGWDVTVVTAQRETFERYTGTDETLEARVDERVVVKRIPFSWPALETDIRRYSRFRVAFPVIWRRLHARLDKLPFPEPGYGPWRPVLEKAVEQVHAEHPVDLVLATANPNVAFLGAWRLHRKAGVPYVMDYRDAWLLDVFSGGRLHGPRSRAARWERKLVREAREIWFVNEPIRRWHRELYPDVADRMQLVANGYDADFRDIHRTPDPDRSLVFGYVGTVTPKVPLAEFIDGWTKARAGDLADAEAHLHGYLGYYHTPRADMLALIEEAESAGVSYRGPVGKTEIHGTYAAMDALLLILGSGRYVTSGKVFEYVSTGLPIVSVHDPANAASDVLRGYPLWFPVKSLAAEDVAEALTAAAAAARRADPAVREQCLQFAEQYARDRQLGPRVEALRTGVVSERATA
jgi:glycosyltransferase involved in cell wall biosynthesis